QQSQDGSKKYLFRLSDGQHVESVLIPEKEHHTLCISTQVGCAQDCRFCMTGTGGFVRNLSSGEIIAQVRDIAYELGSEDMPLSNLVFMGMGEPLANYSNLISALEIINNGEYGLKFSGRRTTVSTAGLVPKIADLGRDTEVNLAISLNAADNETRNRLMPINRTYPIETLLAACRQFPLRPRRRITFEYILMKGINDSQADAERLLKLLRGIRAKINLIPFNDYEGSEFKRSDETAIDRFQDILYRCGCTVMIRRSKGADISAACGQLRANQTIKNPANPD
ncbi:MAG: 23S rRNA (adenine(2503)-C(2))-methyltransferase RlmN, partial [Desulfobacteraceae bacterium]|nr:23S rRNA (adenine(2503)-C(2))-methyltransferase RlmN [Desulfobacteraceae bacterium]